MNARVLCAYIDHTALQPELTRANVEKLCAEAKEYNFHSVCVNSHRVPRRRLRGSSTRASLSVPSLVFLWARFAPKPRQKRLDGLSAKGRVKST